MTPYERKVELAIGTSIGLYSYDEDVGNGILYGTIARYIVLETPPEYRTYLGEEWS
jgi:hypothetical protein